MKKLYFVKDNQAELYFDVKVWHDTDAEKLKNNFVQNVKAHYDNDLNYLSNDEIFKAFEYEIVGVNSNDIFQILDIFDNQY